jgi:hypothetical protein
MEPMRSVRSVSSLPLVSPHTRVLLVLDRQVDVSCLVRATTRHICAHSSIPSCLSILKPLCLVYIDDLFCPHGSRSKPAGRVGRYIYGALHALVGCWHAQCARETGVRTGVSCGTSSVCACFCQGLSSNTPPCPIQQERYRCVAGDVNARVDRPVESESKADRRPAARVDALTHALI